MTRPNNIRPARAMKFLEDNGWELYNKRGTHMTYAKKDETTGRTMFCQVIVNNKTIYWKNAKEMIKKSRIPEDEWLANC